eukprot:CAMPEP_0182546974 /NCGR_PEP_ID=MMETSP1323-20130603/36808_1 /TAXON_ID=236787 /ORGANISM="Florenciella parvula, Strain RCC1693" /LENGTH=97 /DNA_ID=CAMNT_0024758241 /DNA_START=275 /DNA_END=564 /DNA_ORIENTATION=+
MAHHGGVVHRAVQCLLGRHAPPRLLHPAATHTERPNLRWWFAAAREGLCGDVGAVLEQQLHAIHVAVRTCEHQRGRLLEEVRLVAVRFVLQQHLHPT